jgi:hypothetical protein
MTNLASILETGALGKPVHRRDAVTAEKTQRKEMKRVPEKEKRRRGENILFLFFTPLCVSSAATASLR